MFLLAGTGTTLIAYLVYALLVWFGFSVFLALVFEYIIGIGLGFLINGYWIFSARPILLGRVFRYILTYIIIFTANLVMIIQLLNVNLDPLLAQALLLPVMAVFAFVLQNFWVFKCKTNNCPLG